MSDDTTRPGSSTDDSASPASPSGRPDALRTLMIVNAVLAGLTIVIVATGFGFLEGLSDLMDWGFLLLFALVPILALSCMVQFGLGFARLESSGFRRGWMPVLSAPLFFVSAAFPAVVLGSAWGRPLRVRGRQLHPDLREGSDWTRGSRPDPSKLDAPTRAALEALWLHDAQKEHASVPAFSRIAWLLAAVGAPADLMEWAHRAALEEIEHARACFALAAGYGGRSHSVAAMPDLLLGGLDLHADPVVTLATESLRDGCQLEDFNADVARACSEVCREPATRAVLETIAIEERSHAEFSWALLEWTIGRAPAKVLPAVEKCLAELATFPRPTAVNANSRVLVARADADRLLEHGRLPDERWGEIWEARLALTRQRLENLLEQRQAA